MIPAPPQAGVPSAEILGAGVRAELARRNIHPRELAQLLGVTTATVRLRMSGAYPFKPDEMTKVLELLHLSLAELYALSRHGARFTEPREENPPYLPLPAPPKVDLWAQPPRARNRGRAY